MKKIDLFFSFILLPVDISMIVTSFVLSYLIRSTLETDISFNNIGIDQYLHYAFYLIPFWIFLFAVNGLYYTKKVEKLSNELYRIFIVSSTAILTLIVAIFLSHTNFFSRLILVFIWITSIILISIGRVVIRLIRRYLFKAGYGHKKVLIIGDNLTSLLVQNNLKSNHFDYRVVGVLSEQNKQSHNDLKIIGRIEEVEVIIKKYQIDDVVLTDLNLSKNKIIKIIRICSDLMVDFKYIPDGFSLLSVNVTLSLLGNLPVMELRPSTIDGWGRIVKRIIDIGLSLFLLIVLSPLLIIIAIIIKISSPGPVFYQQVRVGREKEKFVCHKFRSMTKDADKKQSWTKEDNPYITPVGKFIRKTNIDELPQLYDILIGTMSFVGPRPEQPEFVEKFEQEIPDYFRRHRVKSGLTGWAQVNGLKGDTSISERVKYDMYYIENWSLWLDFIIIIKTLYILLYEMFKGKYEYRSNS